MTQEALSTVLVTGAGGYVGRYLVPFLNQQGVPLCATVRKVHKRNAELAQYASLVEVGELGDSTFEQLKPVDTVVHLAGRAHVMNEQVEDAYAAYVEGNVEVTRSLINWCKENRVRRFIYMSSIKAIGEETYEHPYTESSACLPEDDYGVTKLAAEQLVEKECKAANIDFIIIRPCLIYGEELVGNLNALSKIVAKGIPLPFKSIQNKRSLVSQENLSKFVLACIQVERKVESTFVLADKKVYSLKDILDLVSNKRRAVLFTVPDVLLRFIFKLPGFRKFGRRLIGNLQVDSSRAHEFADRVLSGNKIK